MSVILARLNNQRAVSATQWSGGAGDFSRERPKGEPWLGVFGKGRRTQPKPASLGDGALKVRIPKDTPLAFGFGAAGAPMPGSLGSFLSRECNGAVGVYACEGERAADQRAARLAEWNVGEEKFQVSVLGERESGAISWLSLQGELKCASLPRWGLEHRFHRTRLLAFGLGC